MGPHKTRNTAILDLPDASIVYSTDSRGHPEMAYGFQCHLISNGKTTLMNGMKVMELKLWESPEVDIPTLNLKIVMPASWTSRMYLAALYETIKDQNILVIQKSNRYSSVNGIERLYGHRKEIVMEMLLSAGYISLL